MMTQPAPTMRFHAKSYEQAAAQCAAEVGAEHWHNCSSADITRWQIGRQIFAIVPEASQDIAAAPGMPSVNCPVWYSITPIKQ